MSKPIIFSFILRKVVKLRLERITIESILNRKSFLGGSF
jgi:hypothetical protein